MGIATIVTMTVATIGSAVAQKVLTSMGKSDEAQYMDLATRSGIAATSLLIFAKFIQGLRNLK